MLGFSPSAEGFGFTYNEDNPLDTDMVVVDEASMLDLHLFYNLLKAINPDTHLLLVGDVDQLPSVGAGDVLNDMIHSGAGPVTRLDTIFRQAETSQIIRNAHRINKGESPDTSNRGDDFFVFVEEDPQAAAELLVSIVQERIPAKFGLDPLADAGGADVPCPDRRPALNDVPERFNPNEQSRAERRWAPCSAWRQDSDSQQLQRRLQWRYRRFTASTHRSVMTVMMDGRPVQYDWSEADELTHAYCISVHRAQGSEYPCVVMPVATQHYMMLQRNLLYTAVTRARQLVVLVGTRKAIAIAVRNDEVARRWTALDWRIRDQAR